MLKKVAIYLCLTGALLLSPDAGEAKELTWQDVLQQAGFDIVETFDRLQDWTPGGQWYSASGCARCPSNSTLPKKLDGSRSIWGFWNNKGLSFQYTPDKGTFAVGDVIIGVTSGTTATVRQVWNAEGKWYIQLTNNNAVRGSSGFVAGERIRSGSKSGANLKWPLFIANHGPEHTWRQGGKSLVLDLGDNHNTDPANPTMAGLGAQRLATFFGDGESGKSGYKKIHAFFMMKIAPTFFKRCLTPGSGCVEGGLDPVNVVKVFELDSGFTGVSRWGSPAEAAQVSKKQLPRLPEYGLNFSVFNFSGGGLSYPQSIFFSENIHVTTGTSPDYSYAKPVAGRKMRSGTTADIGSYVQGGEWFGVEVASDIGTTGNRDGSTDLWIYDNTGKEMGHFAVAGENKLMYFDHHYNKFVLGGNRLSGNGKTGGVDVRWWVDDVIIDGSRIGPAYFRLFPKVISFTAPATSSSFTVSGLALKGTSALGKTDMSYLVTESGHPPAPGAAGWSATPPASYTVASEGVHKLYAWARDGVGNVSFPAAPKTVLVDTAPRR